MNLPIPKDVAERYLQFVGLEGLKKTDNHYYAKCPYCKLKGSSVREPKFYVLMTKGVNVYCHKCGTSKSFANFLSDFSPGTLESIKGEMYFGKKKFEPELILETPKPKEVVKATPDILKELVKVKDNQQATEYCEGRKFPQLVFDEFYFCENYQAFLYKHHLISLSPFKKLDPRIIIPYFDDNDDLTHIQGRSIDKNEKLRYITTTLIENKPKIWGLNRINKQTNINICEGVFDAVFVNNSLAIGSAFADLKVLTEKGITLDKVTFCFDHDIVSNEQLQKAAEKYLNMGARLFIWESYKNFMIKDFNDYVMAGNSLDGLNKMIEDNSFSGFVARLKLKMI
jgi:hypothetical protein